MTIRDPLSVVDAWPAAHVAVAVVSPEGMRATKGPVALPFRLASVTKPLTAYAVLVATEEGTVGLDDPVGPPGSTLAHLLAHASGLGPPGAPAGRPGRRRVYSNAAFEAAAAHVEAGAGVPFGVYLAEAVFDPLGMATRLDGSPAAGAVGSVDDLARFAGELLTPRLVSERTWRRATTVAFPGLAGVVPGFGRHDPNDWGLGFEIRAHKAPHWTGAANSPATFGHFGQSGTFVWVDPVAALACVCLTDADFGPWAAAAWPALSDAVLAAY